MQETYTPYRKPNNDPIHIQNHLKNTHRDLPKSINKRISDTSSNEEIFDNLNLIDNLKIVIHTSTEKAQM